MEQDLEILYILPEDVIHVITGFINHGFKSWTSTCKTLLQLKTYPEVMNRANHFLTIIKFLNPVDLKGDALSNSRNITIDFIFSRPDLNWNLELIFKNSRFDLQELQRIPCFKDYLPFYLYNDNCTINQFYQIFDYMKLTWTSSGRCGNESSHNSEYEFILSDCKFADWEFALNNLSVNWDWFSFYNKPGINLEFILKNIDFEWCWSGLFRSGEITMEFVEEFIKIYDQEIENFDFEGLGYNPNLTLEFMKKHEEIDWSDLNVSCLLPRISIEEIFENPQYKWNYTELLERRCDPEILKILVERRIFQWDDFIAMDVIPFYWLKYKISSLKGVECRKDAIDILMQYPDAVWDMTALSLNKNISKEFFLNSLSLMWNYEFISSQPFLTFDIVCALSQCKWDIIKLSKNSFNYDHAKIL